MWEFAACGGEFCGAAGREYGGDLFSLCAAGGWGRGCADTEGGGECLGWGGCGWLVGVVGRGLEVVALCSFAHGVFVQRELRSLGGAFRFQQSEWGM